MSKKPSYLLPPSFTEDYAKTSVNRHKTFTSGLQKWVKAHHNEVSAEQSKGLLSKLSKGAPSKKKKKIAESDAVIARKLATYLQESYVTLSEFLYTFRRHVTTLDKTMKGPYYMVVHASHDKNDRELPLLAKSSAWLAHTVQEILGRKHALQGMMRVTMNAIIMDKKDSKWPVGSDRNIIYVDDGIYSGQQLLHFVILLSAFMYTNAKAYGTGGTGKTHLWIVIPYRTKRGDYMLDMMESGSFVNDYMEDEIQDPESSYMEDIEDLHGANIRDVVNIAKKYLSIHIVEKNAGSAITNTKEVFEKLGLTYNGLGAGLTIFEHKVPDAVSFPMALTRGALIKDGTVSITKSNIRVPFVSQTDNKPYGQERPGMMRHIIGSTDNMKIPYGIGNAYDHKNAIYIRDN